MCNSKKRKRGMRYFLASASGWFLHSSSHKFTDEPHEEPAMHDSLFSVQDQVVLVSGASRGIGRAIADGFAQRGAKVIITGRESATLEKTARDIGATPMGCDVASGKAIDRPVKAARDQFGQIDTLTHVA